jgi:SAM-dependent methyltransferase
MNCRHCHAALQHVFLDLGFAPPSNAYVEHERLSAPESRYPLRLFVCDRCWLVQTEDFVDAGSLFSPDYAYFSSVSRTWLDHAARYSKDIRQRLALDESSLVLEVAANDGYLLRNFVDAGIPCLGVEPTAATAAAAERLGIPIVRAFFGADMATSLVAEHGRADLIVANNVFAHVPDINDFSVGLARALKPGGTITLEFPHLLRLIENDLFDTVYHEHFSYLSLTTTRAILAAAGLRVVDVEELPTHGGSLRVHAAHDDDARSATPAIAELVARERDAGLLRLDTYRAFQSRVERIADDLVLFLIEQKRAGRKVAGYGAAAKGNTLLNFAGVRADLLPYVCDAAPSKQGKYLPGSHIPIVSPDALRARRPDVVLILPWNIAREVLEQQRDVVDQGATFAVAVPHLRTGLERAAR